MERSEPPAPDGSEPERPGGRGGEAEAALRQLEQRLEAASSAAERLISDAAAQAAATAGRVGDRIKPPPAGWQLPELPGQQATASAELLVGLLDALRDLIPPELRQRLGEALRELLLAVRALIDWYLERLEQRPAAPPEVQDIPLR